VVLSDTKSALGVGERKHGGVTGRGGLLTVRIGIATV